MKRRSVLAWMILSSLLPNLSWTLPQVSEVVSGEVIVGESDPSTMIIQAQDKSIIHYKSFNIAKSEKVRFLQPTQRSSVLNRVTGENPSEILGRMESNGKVFLVNPNGVYFGRESQVDVGSLIVSTLDLSKADFLNERFEFFVQAGKEASEITNLGSLKVDNGGVLALLSPILQNEGTIVAKAGSVLLASGKKVVLDFEGTGLMQFAIEEELEQAMIEQAGSIEALQGQVCIAMSSIHTFVNEVINADHITAANRLYEENGIIRLTASSKIKACEVQVLAREGSHLNISGDLDVSNKESVGGNVHLFAETLFLNDVEINASGKLGGGEVLVGGDFRGEGSYFTARHVEVDPSAHIFSDALSQGDGGKVVVWSRGITFFNGTICSRGGTFMGNGGVVETSGLSTLSVTLGKVNALAPQGTMGTWLLDPMYIEVVAEDSFTTLVNVSNCLDLQSNYSSSGLNVLGGISNSVINNATSRVVLCADSDGGVIILSAPINTSNAGVGVELRVASSGSIVLNKSITTNGGGIFLEGPTFVGSGFINLDTTKNGASPGADILCTGSIDGSSAAANLFVTAGIGEVEFEAPIGRNVPLQSFTVVSGSEVLLASDLMTNSTSIGVSISPPVLLMGDMKIDTTKSGASKGTSIRLGGGVNGTHRLFLNAGTAGIISIAASGQETPLSALQMKASNIALNGDITASGGTMIFEGPVSINANIALIDTGPTGIVFEDTVNCSGGSFTLTLDAPIGRVGLLAGIGSSVAPTTLTISSHSIQLGGDVTVTTTFTCNNAVQLLGDVAISVPTMVFEDTLDGSYDLSLNATAAGTITFSNVVGSSARLGSLTIVNVNTLSSEGIYAENIIQQAAAGTCTYNEFLDTTGSTGISLTGTGGFNFTGGLQAANGGSVVIQSAGTTIATSVTNANVSGEFLAQGGGAVNWQGNIVTQGGDISFSGALNLLGPTMISSGDAGAGSLSFTGAINGAQSLSLSAGGGDVTFSSSVGATTPLGDIILTSAQNVTAAAISALSYTQLSGYGAADYAGNIITTGSLGINITSNYVAFAGETAGVTLTTTNGNILINAIFEGINSLANPVQISVNAGNGTLFVGSASPSYFSGTVKKICAVRTNVPCFVEYNGTEYTPTTCCVSP